MDAHESEDVRVRPRVGRPPPGSRATPTVRPLPRTPRQVPIASPPIPAAPTRTPDLPKFDRIVQWAKDNAPFEVAKIEAHRRTVAACVRAASKMRIWSGEYRRPQRGSMPHPFMQREFPEKRRDKFEPGVFLSSTQYLTTWCIRHWCGLCRMIIARSHRYPLQSGQQCSHRM